jgi:hypothetical protein
MRWRVSLKLVLKGTRFKAAVSGSRRVPQTAKID